MNIEGRSTRLARIREVAETTFTVAMAGVGVLLCACLMAAATFFVRITP